MYSLIHDCTQFYKHANRFLKYTHHKSKSVEKAHINIVDVDGLVKQIFVTFEDKDSIPLYSWVIQYKQDGFFTHKAIPIIQHTNKDDYHSSVAILSTMHDHLENMATIFDFKMRTLDKNAEKLLNFVLNNTEYISLIVKKTAASTMASLERSISSEVKYINGYISDTNQS